MPEELVYYVTRYGYLAIFCIVFLQEVGMPVPFPNEILLMFSGYLSFKGLLYLPFVILTGITADFVGTNMLYFIFYNTGSYIIKKKPKWVPLSSRMIEQLITKISKGGMFNIYIFRLTPFTRGYASVITGLLRIKPKVFLPIALVSAVTWAAIYVITGYLLGPSWNLFAEKIGSFKYLMLVVLVIILCVVLLINHFRKKDKQKMEAGTNNL